jgi:hypothetical protein
MRRRGLGVARGDQACVDYAVWRSIACAWVHLHRAVRVLLDLLHDLVAVALSAVESREDMEDNRSERPRGLDLLMRYIIYPLRI